MLLCWIMVCSIFSSLQIIIFWDNNNIVKFETRMITYKLCFYFLAGHPTHVIDVVSLSRAIPNFLKYLLTCFTQGMIQQMFDSAMTLILARHSQAKLSMLIFPYQISHLISCIIIQQIVTLSKYGHDALDICHP